VRRRAGAARCRVAVRELPGYPPWPANGATEALAARALRIGRDVGLSLAAPRRAGGSDGAFLWDVAPTLDGLGPVGADPHTPRESVERASFVPRALLSARLIEELCAT
jgi:glutamate carboxypeptidase